MPRGGGKVNQAIDLSREDALETFELSATPTTPDKTDMNRSTTAPLVALTIAAALPVARRIPSWGNNQLPMKADNEIADEVKPAPRRFARQASQRDQEHHEQTFGGHMHRALQGRMAGLRVCGRSGCQLR
jgi:hypothetical protein